MSFERITSLCCALVLAACMQTATAQNAAPAESKVDAEQTLRRTLALMRGIQRFEDITPERVSETYGIAFRGAYSALVSSRWQMGISLSTTPRLLARFQVAFSHFYIGDLPPPGEICQFGYDDIVAELTAMGFTRKGQLRNDQSGIYQDFERGELGVQIFSHVYRTNRADVLPENFTPACALRVTIGTHDALKPAIPVTYGQ